MSFGGSLVDHGEENVFLVALSWIRGRKCLPGGSLVDRGEGKCLSGGSLVDLSSVPVLHAVSDPHLGLVFSDNNAPMSAIKQLTGLKQMCNKPAQNPIQDIQDFFQQELHNGKVSCIDGKLSPS